MGQTLRPTKFKDVDLKDKFFDSLKAQYQEFSDWFAKKAAEPVYVMTVMSDRGFVVSFISRSRLERLQMFIRLCLPSAGLRWEL